MMKIITLTLNPAFDKHCFTENFRLGHESFFEITSSDSGGKGINVSRALNSVGVENTALIVVGKKNKEEYLNGLDKNKVNYLPVFVDGRIRENVILHDNSGVETRVSFNGFTVDKSLFSEIEKIIGETDNDTIVTLTGSNPKGLDKEEIKAFVKKLKKSGAKVVIDSRSFTLEDLIELKPFLIKPNKDEVSTYIGSEISSEKDAIIFADKLREKGIENVMVSLGKDGACLSCEEGSFYCPSPKITAISTIGAGDSTVAGFIYATVKGLKGKDKLRLSVAFGSAACLKAGTLPPEKEDIEKIYGKLI